MQLRSVPSGKCKTCSMHKVWILLAWLCSCLLLAGGLLVVDLRDGPLLLGLLVMHSVLLRRADQTAVCKR